MDFVANFICFPALQKFWKCVKIWQNYRQFTGGNFFRDTVYIGPVFVVGKYASDNLYSMSCRGRWTTGLNVSRSIRWATTWWETGRQLGDTPQLVLSLTQAPRYTALPWEMSCHRHCDVTLNSSAIVCDGRNATENSEIVYRCLLTQHCMKAMAIGAAGTPVHIIREASRIYSHTHGRQCDTHCLAMAKAQ